MIRYRNRFSRAGGGWRRVRVGLRRADRDGHAGDVGRRFDAVGEQSLERPADPHDPGRVRHPGHRPAASPRTCASTGTPRTLAACLPGPAVAPRAPRRSRCAPGPALALQEPRGCRSPLRLQEAAAWAQRGSPPVAPSPARRRHLGQAAAAPRPMAGRPRRAHAREPWRPAWAPGPGPGIRLARRDARAVLRTAHGPGARHVPESEPPRGPHGQG